jgi:hypothetical protein
MRDDDATLRDAAARSLRSFVKAAAAADHVRDICRDDLVPHVLDALALADDSRRRAHVSVLVRSRVLHIFSFHDTRARPSKRCPRIAATATPLTFVDAGRPRRRELWHLRAALRPAQAVAGCQ